MDDHRYRPKSIDDYGGIRPYLNDPDIIEQHNGYDCKAIERMVKDEVPITKIAKRITPEGRKEYDPSTVRRWKILLGL